MPQNPRNPINEIRTHLKDDKLSMFYQGKFDDKFTALLINLAQHASEAFGIGNKKRRMGMLMAESFQNIVRHGIVEDDNKISKDLFGIRNIVPYVHIFSANQIDANAASILEERLSKYGQMDTESLNAHYKEALMNNDMSEKGGAGLGLIEMARKSNQPLQHRIKRFNSSDNKTEFGLQIDMLLDKSLIGTELNKLDIKENQELYQLLQNRNVILLFNGDFTTETITPILDILKQNSENSLVKKRKFYKLYHIAVELLQNVIRHGAIRNNIKLGTFILSVKDEMISLSAGNYVTEEQEDFLLEHIEQLNAYSKEELDTLYMETLRESALVEDSGGKVGIIDIARISNTKLEFESFKDESGTFFAITANFK